MTAAEFEKHVARAISAIPPQFMERVDNLSFQVHPWADEETLQCVGLTDPRDLLGYYMGWPLPERTHEYGSCSPDVIIIYQDAVESYIEETGQPLEKVLLETVMHELAHYFGFTEDEMDIVERLWEQQS
ncbi:MAG: metallopeptidase family protein [Geoalkalibacter sp.]|uniref:metallopeptidase family protein n=1 Tax=Geoalkalibacter sp. TaxID=3041440 RepID=UPI003D12CD83